MCITISWVSVRKNTLFWCLPMETNGLSLTISLFGIPGEEEMTGFRHNASWSVEKCDEKSVLRKCTVNRPSGSTCCGKLHVVKSGHLLPFVELFCSSPSGIINDFCCAGTVAEGFWGVAISVLWALCSPPGQITDNYSALLSHNCICREKQQRYS